MNYVMNDVILVMIFFFIMMIITIVLLGRTNIRIDKEIQDLTITIDRLKDKVISLSSDYSILYLKAEDYDIKVFKKRINEICNKYNIEYTLDEKFKWETVNSLYDSHSHRRCYLTLSILTKSIPAEFLNELSGICDYDILKEEHKDVVNIKIKEQ